MSLVVGLDLSLTRTGIAGVGGIVHPWTCRIPSKPDGDTLASRALRILTLRNKILEGVGAPQLVVVEGPSHGQQRQGGQFDRAGLWWEVVAALHRRRIPVAEVPPATRAKWMTGRGNAPKDAVLAAAVRHWPDVDITGNDEADALILAAMGHQALTSHPSPAAWRGPEYRRDALMKVKWPEDIAARLLEPYERPVQDGAA